MSPRLPIELVEEIIDIVAECCPESLPRCAVVSHHWTPRSLHHLYRIFRTPTIATLDGLHHFADIVNQHPRLAALATTLRVVPELVFNQGTPSSYLPFHLLSSRVLPNVRHLALGETLRWADYPLVYRRSIAGFFCGVTTIDLSCYFGSVSDLFHIVRSFKDIKTVRLIYPNRVPAGWIEKQPQILLRGRASSFKLHNLELSLAVVKPILDAFGHSVVNLSVVCPEMSTVASTNAPENRRPTAHGSLTMLQAVKLIVPVESDDPTNHSGLGKLRDVLLPLIIKPDIRYSLSLVRCPEHNAVGYSVEDINVEDLREVFRSAAESRIDTLLVCAECEKACNKPSPPSLTTVEPRPTPPGHRADTPRKIRCQWEGCAEELDGATLAGVSTHFHRFHRRSRGTIARCRWGSRCRNMGMLFDSDDMVDHIAECHLGLLSEVVKVCKTCGHTFWGTDIFGRHTFAGCRSPQQQTDAKPLRTPEPQVHTRLTRTSLRQAEAEWLAQPHAYTSTWVAQQQAYTNQSRVARQQVFTDRPAVAQQQAFIGPSRVTQQQAYVDRSKVSQQQGHADRSGRVLQQQASADRSRVSQQRGLTTEQSRLPEVQAYPDPRHRQSQQAYIDSSTMILLWQLFEHHVTAGADES